MATTPNPPAETTPAAAPSPQPETVIWEGCSSQVVNFRVFLYCFLSLVAIGLLAWGFDYISDPVRNAWLHENRRWFYLILGLLALAPILVALYHFIENHARRYRVTTERIHLESGVLSKNVDHCELYRVRDYLVKRPFFLRLFGLATVEMITSDKSTPVLRIEAIRNAEDLQSRIRDRVETLRRTKRVREVDFE